MCELMRRVSPVEKRAQRKEPVGNGSVNSKPAHAPLARAFDGHLTFCFHGWQIPDPTVGKLAHRYKIPMHGAES